MAIASGNGISQTTIVRATAIDRSTTSGLVRRLTKKGRLHRRRSKKVARAYGVRLNGNRIVGSKCPSQGPRSVAYQAASFRDRKNNRFSRPPGGVAGGYRPTFGRHSEALDTEALERQSVSSRPYLAPNRSACHRLRLHPTQPGESWPASVTAKHCEPELAWPCVGLARP
jgi:hypothetical protein